MFLLRELGGFSYGEIAVQLDISVPAVQMLLFRARQKLRVELGRSGSVRLGGLIPVPHWLLGFADRVPASFAVPRVAGLVAASVIAAGVGVTSDVSSAEPTAPQTEQGRAATQIASTVRGPTARRGANTVRRERRSEGRCGRQRQRGAGRPYRTARDPGDKRPCSCACPRPFLAARFPSADRDGGGGIAATVA